MPDPIPARKSRLGLYLPFILLLVGIVAWTCVWFWMRIQVQDRLAAAQAGLRAAGYDIDWDSHSIGGYPFRLDVTLVAPRLRDPSGWALAASRLEGEAYVLTPGHWIVAAPQGLEFTRPRGGPVSMKGQLIRASLSNLDKRPPNVSFEAVKVAFTPAPGAQPFGLSTADRVEFHLRAGPDDQGGVFAKVDGGKARPLGLLARVAGDKPVAMVWNSTLSRMSAFTGATWPRAVRAWTDAGGQMSVRNAGVTAGEAILGAQGGMLTVGSDGRLRGSLDLSLRQAPRAISALGETGAIAPEAAAAAAALTAARQQGDLARAALTFEAGQTTLGPVAIAPAPRVY